MTRPTSTFIHIEWDKDLLLRAFPPPKPKPETTMRQFPIELEAQAAARRLYDTAIVLNATPDSSRLYTHRLEDFHEAMDQMERIIMRRNGSKQEAA